MPIVFRVSGQPIPQPRPRVFVQKCQRCSGRGRIQTGMEWDICPVCYGGGGRGKAIEAPHGHAIYGYKDAVRLSAKVKWGNRAPVEYPIALEIVFLLRRPAYKISKIPCGREPVIGRSDLDNFAKGAIDAIKGIIWKDDNQIYQLHLSKWLVASGEEPATIFLVSVT